VFARKLIRLSPGYDNRTAKNELRAIAKLGPLGHPNIITFLDHGTFEDLTYCFIDMELCSMSLDEYNKGNWIVARFQKTSREREHRTRLIMCHIAKGLAFIHENGEVHRDVKPTNGSALSTSSHESVLYSKDDTWKLADLGLSLDFHSASAFWSSYNSCTRNSRIPCSRSFDLVSF
jgi:serine/threonine protein kinase